MDFARRPGPDTPPSHDTSFHDPSLHDPSFGYPALATQEADRSFSAGVHYESAGLFRPALQSFHSAATLYKCALDHPPEFSHTTRHGPGQIRPLLAYACVRLAHLEHDALDDPAAAKRLYLDAIELDPEPSAVSFDGLGTSLEANGGPREEALEAYRKAHERSPSAQAVAFHLAVCAERSGDGVLSRELFDRLRSLGGVGANSLVDSWGYVRWHMRKTGPEELNLHRGTRAMLELGLERARPLIESGGLVCEFGVSYGRSTRILAELLPPAQRIAGFDSFEGLPQAWGGEPAGSYTTNGEVPSVAPNVEFRAGLFADTVPVFLAEPDQVRPRTRPRALPPPPRR
jgi:tetratricopeptide (TPR) repeat protein